MGSDVFLRPKGVSVKLLVWFFCCREDVNNFKKFQPFWGSESPILTIDPQMDKNILKLFAS